MLNVNSAEVNNNKTQVSIMELDGRTYIVYLKTVGMYQCYLEDFETKKRASSDKHENASDAIEDAWRQILKG
ncbi:hypothetical protein G7L40_20055 [Paenibacillus polymyxa]|uniref:Uncharacterized protein n=1 Tax=Paenibacillus polymyxa TaxID=1406 RepID=A0A378Y0E3_PAEPO|nr:hypothetical protein [Paenibacillus polymyxa]MBE7896217.1 hypothetical protein [Paenibacillus polymyxa]MBG9765849.1 hypothetical protein [Paenibacillus polymyxa]MCC3256746.1 hypothetical protein [Paenibacillus polymyxa]QPK54766.1 hypothetical protein G7035_20095 [Paenibacillus polymyxa]QPK59857.1 hypothetical protein G7L40_20055 [Paenibacillus polymyxa]